MRPQSKVIFVWLDHLKVAPFFIVILRLCDVGTNTAAGPWNFTKIVFAKFCKNKNPLLDIGYVLYLIPSLTHPPPLFPENIFLSKIVKNILWKSLTWFCTENKNYFFLNWKYFLHPWLPRKRTTRTADFRTSLILVSYSSESLNCLDISTLQTVIMQCTC